MDYTTIWFIYASGGSDAPDADTQEVIRWIFLPSSIGMVRIQGGSSRTLQEISNPVSCEWQASKTWKKLERNLLLKVFLSSQCSMTHTVHSKAENMLVGRGSGKGNADTQATVFLAESLSR